MTTLAVLAALLCAAWFLLANVVPLLQLAERRRVASFTRKERAIHELETNRRAIATRQSPQAELEGISWLPLIVLAVALFVAVIWP